MPNIYKLADDYLMLADKLANTTDDDGAIDQSLLPVVSEARELVESKSKSIGGVIKDLEAIKQQIDKQSEWLNERSQIIDKRITWLKNSLSNVLQACGIERIEGVHTVISFRKSSAVEYSDVSEIPDEYMATKVTVKPDANKIRDAIKAGITVPGAYIAERQNIQIK